MTSQDRSVKTEIERLIAKWRERAEQARSEPGSHVRGECAVTRLNCANELESLLSALIAEAPQVQKESARVCQCGHVKGMHPVGLSENLTCDGSCSLCQCRKFQAAEAPSQPYVNAQGISITNSTNDNWKQVGFQRVRGRCPACGSDSLFLGSFGYVTCSVLS